MPRESAHTSVESAAWLPKRRTHIQVWETGDRDKIRRAVLRGLNAAKGGGYIFQSDHSVASDVAGQTYDFIIGLLREHGRYPLRLGELDEEV